MSSKAKFGLSLGGMVVVLICDMAMVFERSLGARPAFLLGFGVISALGFWAMSFHRLGR